MSSRHAGQRNAIGQFRSRLFGGEPDDRTAPSVVKLAVSDCIE